jgi:hypothetical protein
MSNKSRSKGVFARPRGIPGPSATEPWAILYFKRHRSDDPEETRPGRVNLNGLPPRIRAQLMAVIKAVADAPPPAHSGGGKWEVMKGDMAGYQIKADGFENGRRLHYRLFCLLERNGRESIAGLFIDHPGRHDQAVPDRLHRGRLRAEQSTW